MLRFSHSIKEEIQNEEVFNGDADVYDVIETFLKFYVGSGNNPAPPITISTECYQYKTNTGITKNEGETVSYITRDNEIIFEIYDTPKNDLYYNESLVAFSEGLAAKMTNVSIHDNPYIRHEDNKLSIAWVDGWVSYYGKPSKTTSELHLGVVSKYFI